MVVLKVQAQQPLSASDRHQPLRFRRLRIPTTTTYAALRQRLSELSGTAVGVGGQARAEYQDGEGGWCVLGCEPIWAEALRQAAGGRALRLRLRP